MERRNNTIKAAQVNWVLINKRERGMSHSARALYDLRVPLPDAIRLLTREDNRRQLYFPQGAFSGSSYAGS